MRVGWRTGGKRRERESQRVWGRGRLPPLAVSGWRPHLVMSVTAIYPCRRGREDAEPSGANAWHLEAEQLNNCLRRRARLLPPLPVVSRASPVGGAFGWRESLSLTGCERRGATVVGMPLAANGESSGPGSPHYSLCY